MSSEAMSPKTTRLPLTLIAAVSPCNGIGKNGGLPWSLKGEMAYFRRATMHVPEASSTARNAVIMGRTTWESIPPKFRPLKDRVNVVVSRSVGPEREKELGIQAPDSHLVSSMESALDVLSSHSVNRAFLIGGSQLYTQALQANNLVGSLLITRILTPDFDCDVFLPEFRTQKQIDLDNELISKAGGKANPQVTSPESLQIWTKHSYADLAQLIGGEKNVQSGIVSEGDVKYEFQFWTRSS